MSGLDDRFLLMRASIDANKDDADEKMDKFRKEFASILDKLIEMVKHMFHHIIASFQENYVEDDGLLEITKSTYETKASKSDPSIFKTQNK